MRGVVFLEARFQVLSVKPDRDMAAPGNPKIGETVRLERVDSRDPDNPEKLTLQVWRPQHFGLLAVGDTLVMKLETDPGT